MGKVVGYSPVVKDGTYESQFTAGCLECCGIIGVDSVGETSTANKSAQRHEKFVDGHY